MPKGLDETYERILANVHKDPEAEIGEAIIIGLGD